MEVTFGHKKGEPTFAYRISGLSTACMTDKCKVAHTLWGYSAQWHIHVQGESVLRLSCHACELSRFTNDGAARTLPSSMSCHGIAAAALQI